MSEIKDFKTLDLVFPERVLVKETECNESGWGTVFGYDFDNQKWVIRLDDSVRLSNGFLDDDYATRLLLFSENEIIESASEWTVDSKIRKEHKEYYHERSESF